MSQSRSRILNPVFRGGGAAFPKGKQIDQFWHKVAPSLNGVDPSLHTQLLDPTCRAKCSNILHDMSTDFESLECFDGCCAKFIYNQQEDCIKKPTLIVESS